MAASVNDSCKGFDFGLTKINFTLLGALSAYVKAAMKFKTTKMLLEALSLVMKISTHLLYGCMK